MAARAGRSRSLIYAFPMMMDTVGGLIGFTAAVRAAKLGASTSMVAALGATGSTAYLVTSFILGRHLNPRRSGAFIVAASAGAVTVSALFALVSEVPQFFPLMALGGASMATFFVSFQVFMKAVDTGGRRPISSSAGTYVFSWSVGFALGPFISGFLMELQGSQAAAQGAGAYVPCYTVSGGLALMTGIAALLLRHYAEPGENRPSAVGSGSAGSQPDCSGMPDMAWVGWVASGTGVMLFWIIVRLFPKEATVLGWRDGTKGLVLFLMCTTQALVAFGLRRSRTWMYDWRRVCAFGACGIAGLTILSLGKAPPAYCAGAVLFGVYSGSFFFYFVFHSLSHPKRSARYVSINETVVGTAGILGPMWGGLVADLGGFEPMYLFGALLVGAALAFQVTMHRRYVTRLPNWPAPGRDRPARGRKPAGG